VVFHLFKQHGRNSLTNKVAFMQFWINFIKQSYLTWIKFRVDKISRFREFLGVSRKLIHAKYLKQPTLRKSPRKSKENKQITVLFAKINPRENFKIGRSRN
jgi:hypothetical protein